MIKKYTLLLFHLIFYQKLFLDEFSEIDMKLVQNSETLFTDVLQNKCF